MRYTQHQNCTRFTVGLGKADYLKNPNINQSLNLPVSSIGVILSFTNLIEWGKWVKWTHVKVPFSLHACMGCAYYQWFSSVQFGRSVVSDSLPPHGPQHGQASVSITNSQSLLRLMSIESVMPSNHLILCRPLLPPSIFPSIRVFSNESVFCISWPKSYQSLLHTSFRKHFKTLNRKPKHFPVHSKLLSKSSGVPCVENPVVIMIIAYYDHSQ